LLRALGTAEITTQTHCETTYSARLAALGRGCRGRTHICVQREHGRECRGLGVKGDRGSDAMGVVRWVAGRFRRENAQRPVAGQVGTRESGRVEVTNDMIPKLQPYHTGPIRRVIRSAGNL
jgi:hypothetical protein